MGTASSNNEKDTYTSQIAWCSAYVDSLKIYDFNEQKLRKPFKQVSVYSDKDRLTRTYISHLSDTSYLLSYTSSEFENNIKIFDFSKKFHEVYYSGDWNQTTGLRVIEYNSKAQMALIPSDDRITCAYRIFDCSKLQIIKRAKAKLIPAQKDSLCDATLNAEGTRITAFDSGGMLYLVDFFSGSCIKYLTTPRAGQCRWSPTAESAIVGVLSESNVNLFDWETQKFLYQDTIDSSFQVSCFDWQKDGNLIAAVSKDTVYVYDTRANRVTKKYANTTNNHSLSRFMRCVKWSPDGNLLAASTGGVLRVFELGAEKVLYEKDNHADVISSICFLGANQ